MHIVHHETFARLEGKCPGSIGRWAKSKAGRPIIIINKLRNKQSTELSDDNITQMQKLKNVHFFPESID